MRRLSAVWFADLVGFTALSARDEPRALQIVAQLQQLAAVETSRQGGRIVKYVGDAILAEFPSSEAAVLAALALRTGFTDGQLRIGLHAGEINEGEDGDIYGDAVNFAARIHAAAPAASIIISEDVWRHLRMQPQYEFNPLGRKKLKGIEGSPALYLIERASAAHAGRRFGKLIVELRRRRVGRVALTYAVAAWALVEVASTIFPRLLFPDWTVTALLVAALVGFPVALVLSWSFDIVPDSAAAGTKQRMRRWTGVVAAGAVLALATAMALPFMSRVIATKAPISSLVVLPFENLGSNPEEEYFVAGIYDGLIGELSQVSALRIISRRSAQQYAGSTKPVTQIARELSVDGVVDGSVTRTANGVQIRIALIKVLPEERQLWAQAFTSELRDVPSMHGNIARTIAQKIRVELTSEQEARLSSARPVDPAMYEAYLRGMYYLQQPPEKGREKGLGYLQQAIDLDPANPAAYAGLAQGYATIGHGPAPTPDVWERAREAALRAIKLDPLMAEAHAALADVKLYYEWDWAGAEAEFKRANELNPSLAFNHYHYSWYLTLMGRTDEAIAEHKRAQALDPLTPAHTAHLSVLYGMAGRIDEAARETSKAVDMRPDGVPVLATLGALYLRQGKYTEAIATHERMVQISPSQKPILGLTFAMSGRLEDARRIATELESKPSPWHAFWLASIYGTLGDYDRAFEWLNYQPNHAWLPWMRVEAWQPAQWLAPLKDDPRYRALFERMRLPPPAGKPVAIQSNRTS